MYRALVEKDSATGKTNTERISKDMPSLGNRPFMPCQTPLEGDLTSPKSDQHQISPCNNNVIFSQVVSRIKDRITKSEFA